MSVHLTDRQRFVVAVFLLLAFVVTIALYAPDQVIHRLVSKWERFILLSGVFVAFVMKAYWKVRQDLRFWTIFLSFMVVHFIGVGYFFWTGNGLPFPIFEIAIAVELGGFALVIYWVLGIGPTEVNFDL